MNRSDEYSSIMEIRTLQPRALRSAMQWPRMTVRRWMKLVAMWAMSLALIVWLRSLKHQEIPRSVVVAFVCAIAVVPIIAMLVDFIVITIRRPK